MHEAAADRYERIPYARCGRSGLKLPRISLGLWQNFGSDAPFDAARDMVLKSFDRGITHFDLANNYGPSPGSAEENFGRILACDLAPHRDELIVSTKAGYRMWPGPYGEWGSRKYIIASCDQSLKRTGLDYFDIFYSHRPDPGTPLEETMGALDTLVKHGKALYVGVSSYSGVQLEAALEVVRRDGLAPITIHQPYYNMLGRRIEADLLPHTDRAAVGVIAFCPLASGLLSGSKYLDGIVPADSRPAREWASDWVTSKPKDERKRILNGLNDLARERGQSLAQMAVAWVLRHKGMVSVAMGASRREQVEQNVAALAKLAFTPEELGRIDSLTLADSRSL